MVLTPNFKSDKDKQVPVEEPIWKTDIPSTNYWIQEGRYFLETLTMDDVIYHIRMCPQAKNDFLAAVNPKRKDYVALVNVPPADYYNSDKMADGLNRCKDTLILWTNFKGIPPGQG
jgi:hypothetical protein